MENNKQEAVVNRYFFLAIIIIFASFLMWSLLSFFTAFLAALMFYVLSKPSVEWLLRRWKWSKAFIAIIVIVVSFFIILLPVGVVGTMLYGKIVKAALNPTTIIKPIKHFGEIIEHRYNINIISSSIGAIQDYATGLVSTILNSSFDFFTTIGMMYFFLYFMITNTNRMEAATMLYLPFKRSHMKLFGAELEAQTFSNSVVVPLIVVIHGILATIAYLICGVPDPGFWGVVTGFASVIPMVGTGLIWVPMSIYLLVQNHTWQGVFLIAWGIVIIGMSDNLIRFLLAKKMADIHPIVTVLGVIIGLRFFGITGLIFGPLIISYFLILIRIYYLEYQKPKPNAQLTAQDVKATTLITK